MQSVSGPDRLELCRLLSTGLWLRQSSHFLLQLKAPLHPHAIYSTAFMLVSILGLARNAMIGKIQMIKNITYCTFHNIHFSNSHNLRLTQISSNLRWYESSLSHVLSYLLHLLAFEFLSTVQPCCSIWPAWYTGLLLWPLPTFSDESCIGHTWLIHINVSKTAPYNHIIKISTSLYIMLVYELVVVSVYNLMLPYT